MKLTFNQLGVLTDIVYDTAYRQGSVGTTVTAKFTNRANYDYVAKLNITRPDDTTLTNLIMLPSSTNTDEFSLVFNDEWFFAVAGTTTLTVYLYDGGGNVLAQGQVQFDIQETDYSDDPPSITTEQYNTLLAAMTNKLNKYTGDYGIYATDGEGEQTILNYSNDHENGDTVVMRKSNGQLDVPQTPSSNNDAASKKYVDDNVNLKQNKLVAGLGINIETNPENANQQIISSYFYNCSVTTNLSDLYEKFEDSAFLLNTSDRGFAGKITYDNSVYHFEFLEIGNNRKYIGNVGDTLVYSILTGTTYKVDFYEKSEIDTLLSNIYIKSEVDGLISTEQLARSSADTALQNSKLDKTDVVDSLTDTSSTKPLSAGKGKQLKDAIDTINSILSSDDTDLDTIQEIVNFIKDNKDVIDSVSTNKINYTDIVDNLTTAESGKPLSAKQGKVLKDLLDALTIVVGTKANSSDVYTKTQSDSLLDAKADKSTTYTKTEIDTMVDGFVFADIDDELDDESTNPLENATVTRELNKKANIDGNYPTMTVGQAEGIVSNREIEDADVSCKPITFGIAGGEAEIQTGINKFEYLEGKSIKFIQQAPDTVVLYNSYGLNLTLENATTNEYKATIKSGYTEFPNRTVFQKTVPLPAVNGDKILLVCQFKGSLTSTKQVSLFATGTGMNSETKTVTNEWQYLSYIGKRTNNGGDGRTYLELTVSSGAGNVVEGDYLSIRGFMFFNLTQMGLDSITTLDEFLAIYPFIYYPKAETILSAKSHQLISRGKNQFSELNTYIPVVGGKEYELSGISAGGVLTQYDANKNLIATSETFTDTVDITLEDNARYVKINATTYEDIMFYLTFPEDGGVYNEPYVAPRVETVQLPNIELRSVGDVKDIAYATGGGLRKIGIVDLGTLDWNYVSEYTRFYSGGLSLLVQGLPYSVTIKPNIICSKYDTSTNAVIYDETGNKVISLDADGYILLRDTSYTDGSVLKSALSGVYLLYELATPTEIPLSENPGWTENVFVDNFGTLEFVTSPAQVPQVEQPYFIRYTISLSEFLDTAYTHAEGDANKLALQKDVDDIVSGETVTGESKLSQNLTPYSEDSGATDTSAFTLQSSGGNSDIGSLAYLRALRGNSVAFNQLNPHDKLSGTINDVSFTKNNDGSWTINGTASANSFKIISSAIPLISGHKYLLKGAYGGSSSTYSLYEDAFAKYDNGEGKIFTANSSSNASLGLKVNSGANISNKKVYPQLFDLTLMFGAGNEPTTVVEFNRLFPKPYYEYNTGTLLSAKSNGYKTVGYNALSLDRTAGTLNGNDYSRYNQQNFDATKYYCGLANNDYVLKDSITVIAISDNSITLTSDNDGYCVAFPVRVVAGQSYTLEYTISGYSGEKFVSWYDKNGNYIFDQHNNTGLFTAPDNAYWGVVLLGRDAGTWTYSNICFHLTWDGSKTGYEPYETHTYALPNIELKSAGSVYDELKSDGTLIRRIGVVDLGTLNWSYSGNYNDHCYIAYLEDAYSSSNIVANILCAKYPSIKNSDQLTASKGISNYSKYIRISDSDYVNNLASFKTALSGVMLYYELATPIEEQTSNTFQEITPIDDFGTQEFLYDNDINIPVPQGAEFFYPVDYKAFIDTLYNKVEGDTTEFVTQSDLTTALSTFLTSITGYDATKSQTLKHDNSGNVKWVDD